MPRALVVSLCATAFTALFAGCSSGGGSTAAAAVDYGSEPVLLRASGGAIILVPDLTGIPAGVSPSFRVEPAFPAGLTLDAQNGYVSGTPVTATPRADYTIFMTVDAVESSTTVQVVVGPQLPSEFEELDEAYAAVAIGTNLQQPTKIACAEDGRVFFTELMTGKVRAVTAAGTIEPTAFATIPVTTGGHQGLLGIALSPTFATDHYLYVSAVVPAGAGKPQRIQVLRFDATTNVGSNQTVVLDDLPFGAINNGGELVFDDNGMLFLSLGDMQRPSEAQDDNLPTGKILRFSPVDGSAPADNPLPGNRLWAKGLRNTFALAVHPAFGYLLGADNGPDSDDWLGLLAGGKNFAWGAVPGTVNGSVEGFRLREWPTVIVPTGLAWLNDNTLMMSTYEHQEILRFRTSGSDSLDIDSLDVFARFIEAGNGNKPLDVQIAPNGSLYVSTFSGLFRIEAL